MPYVRTRGNQVLIVHGSRIPETGKVEQQILFTLYSKEEALAAIEQVSGKEAKPGTGRFERMLAELHPEVRFDWKKIRQAIRSNMGVLPETYESRKNRVVESFRDALVTFTRELAILDPQSFKYAYDLISSHRAELEHLRDLIDWRLGVLAHASKLNWGELEGHRDDRFSWIHSMVGKEVPGEIEEMVEAKLESGDVAAAEKLHRLYTESFENHADGHLGMGSIALERGALPEAETHFKQAVAVGRKLFPKRIAKSSYWSDHKTRPFLRAQYSLCLTYNKLGRFDEAGGLCDRIEKEYGQDITADLYRANIYLNQGKPELAFKAASRLIRLYPEQGFIAAWAAFEDGQRADADAYFIFAAMNKPRAAAMIAGRATKSRPNGYEEVRDHDDAVGILDECCHFLARQSSGSKKHFRALFESELVQNGMKRLAQLRKLQEDDRKKPGPSPHFDEISRAKSIEHAKGLAMRRTSPGFGKPDVAIENHKGDSLVH